MLSEHLARYTALQRAVGFKFRTPGALLENFVAFAEDRGDAFIRIDRVLDWAVQAPSPAQRRNRLLTVRRFALSLRAEDPRHEVPAADALGPRLSTRRVPHIYQRDEINGLIQAAYKLKPVGSIRPLTYATLFGLLAATGLRISEALALQLDDLTEDGLIIRQTKFHKSRLLPLHATTRHALAAYLAVRLKIAGPERSFFVARSGKPLPYSTVVAVFLKIVRSIGLRHAPGNPGPRLHDYRHTFAVTSLEQCHHDPDVVARHLVALSTYLGHAHVTDTYWYLQATPLLMRQVAQLGEALHQGDCP